MIVELLYFDGCPHASAARRLLADVLATTGTVATVVETKVKDDSDARTRRFIGSPTIRVDGMDIEEPARSIDRFGMMCRLYRDGHRTVGVPP